MTTALAIAALAIANGDKTGPFLSLEQYASQVQGNAKALLLPIIRKEETLDKRTALEWQRSLRLLRTSMEGETVVKQVDVTFLVGNMGQRDSEFSTLGFSLSLKRSLNGSKDAINLFSAPVLLSRLEGFSGDENERSEGAVPASIPDSKIQLFRKWKIQLGQSRQNLFDIPVTGVNEEILMRILPRKHENRLASEFQKEFEAPIEMPTRFSLESLVYKINMANSKNVLIDKVLIDPEIASVEFHSVGHSAKTTAYEWMGLVAQALDLTWRSNDSGLCLQSLDYSTDDGKNKLKQIIADSIICNSGNQPSYIGPQWLHWKDQTARQRIDLEDLISSAMGKEEFRRMKPFKAFEQSESNRVISIYDSIQYTVTYGGNSRTSALF